MSETDQQPVVSAEGKSAATEFLATFKSFKDDMSKSITDMGTRIEAIDRKASDTRRPALSLAAESELPHAKAFSAYVRSGNEDGLRTLSLEGKGLQTGVDSEGGFLVDPQTSEMIETVLRSGASIRALANVVQVEAGSYDVLVDHNEIGFGWIPENGTVSETAAPIVDRIAITLHELSASPSA
ncbi:MAG: phage major capsid protein, partial [Pseudomonadota bacterium]